MKKLIITLTILILWTSKGISQTSSDSVTCIPNVQLRKAINLIENGKVAIKELEAQREKVVFLEYRIFIKDSVISQYQKKEDNWKKIDANYKQQLFNYDNYTKNTQKIFEEQKRQIRGLKLKKWLGILAGVGVGYVIAK